ncbi:Putative short-chain type dehydrogenase/reductase [bacterium HR19]|nr:Putative short-chain type dehydrogenase/reductase [bacterium HR19]
MDKKNGVENPEKLLEGKAIVVTGGGGGIGSEVCMYLAKLGAKILVSDPGTDIEGKGRNPTIAESVVEKIREEGGIAYPNYDSITSEEGAKNIVKNAVDLFGKIDGLVNCAGNIKDAFTLDMTLQDFENVLKVNLIGAFLIGRECLRVMVEKGISGSIINMTSVAGILGNWGQANFASAKAGLIGLTKTWAIEFAKYGIRVNLIAPTVKTRITKTIPFFKSEEEDMLHPKHVAPVVAFLLSDLSREINGALIAVYGTKLFSFHIVQTEGAMKKSMWNPYEIKDKIKTIFE